MKGYRVFRIHNGAKEYLDQERDVWYREGVPAFATYLEAKERFRNFKKSNFYYKETTFKQIRIEGPNGGSYTTNLTATDAGIAKHIFQNLKSDLRLICAHDMRDDLLKEWKMRFDYFLRTQKPNSLKTHQIIEMTKWIEQFGFITRSEFFMYLLGGAE